VSGGTYGGVMRQPAEGQCVVFDLDGVIVDSEPLWIQARQDLVRAAGGRWLPEAGTAMMGISSDRCRSTCGTGSAWTR
jgi:beta-phosphoglucomutase-like phosphatase (HAD superfamily)